MILSFKAYRFTGEFLFKHIVTICLFFLLYFNFNSDAYSGTCGIGGHCRDLLHCGDGSNPPNVTDCSGGMCAICKSSVSGIDAWANPQAEIVYMFGTYTWSGPGGLDLPVQRITLSSNKCGWLFSERFCMRPTAPGGNGNNTGDGSATNPGRPQLCGFEDPLDGADKDSGSSPTQQGDHNDVVVKNVGCVDREIGPAPPAWKNSAWFNNATPVPLFKLDSKSTFQSSQIDMYVCRDASGKEVTPVVGCATPDHSASSDDPNTPSYYEMRLQSRSSSYSGYGWISCLTQNTDTTQAYSGPNYYDGMNDGVNIDLTTNLPKPNLAGLSGSQRMFCAEVPTTNPDKILVKMFQNSEWTTVASFNRPGYMPKPTVTQSSVSTSSQASMTISFPSRTNDIRGNTINGFNSVTIFDDPDLYGINEAASNACTGLANGHTCSYNTPTGTTLSGTCAVTAATPTTPATDICESSTSITVLPRFCPDTINTSTPPVGPLMQRTDYTGYTGGSNCTPMCGILDQVTFCSGRPCSSSATTQVTLSGGMVVNEVNCSAYLGMICAMGYSTAPQTVVTTSTDIPLTTSPNMTLVKNTYVNNIVATPEYNTALTCAPAGSCVPYIQEKFGKTVYIQNVPVPTCYLWSNPTHAQSNPPTNPITYPPNYCQNYTGACATTNYDSNNVASCATYAVVNNSPAADPYYIDPGTQKVRSMNAYEAGQCIYTPADTNTQYQFDWNQATGTCTSKTSGAAITCPTTSSCSTSGTTTTCTYATPAHCGQVTVEAWGGGAAGSGVQGDDNGCDTEGAGSEGAYGKWTIPVSELQSLTIKVGQGGNDGNTKTSGTSSSVSYGTSNVTAGNGTFPEWAGCDGNHYTNDSNSNCYTGPNHGVGGTRGGGTNSTSWTGATIITNRTGISGQCHGDYDLGPSGDSPGGVWTSDCDNGTENNPPIGAGGCQCDDCHHSYTIWGQGGNGRVKISCSGTMTE